jgi:carbonic anhydrase
MKTNWMVRTALGSAVAVAVLGWSSVTVAAEEGHGQEKAAAAAPAAHAAPHWSYEGDTGPESWGKLSPDFATCATGKSQSPIDISAATVSSLDDIKVSYQASPLKVKNNGHTIQVDYAAGSSIQVGDKQYDLKQFHFHTPSEESIGGQRFTMVTHFVHKAADGSLGVIGVLMKEGAENAALKAVFDNMPTAEGEKEVAGTQVNAADILPKDLTYFNFSGSLTTPPCSEGVNWMVVADPIEISPAQAKAFQTIFAMNARPIQPVNGRVVRLDNH